MYKKFPIIIVFLVLLSAAFFLTYRHFSSKTDTYTTSGDTSQKDTTKKITSVNERPPSDNVAPESTTPSSVSVPEISKQYVFATYPVENGHYKIEQSGSQSFRITLFAISSSPSQYDSYVMQLKEYKAEALAYLSARYGDISTFEIEWIPPEAESL